MRFSVPLNICSAIFPLSVKDLFLISRAKSTIAHVPFKLLLFIMVSGIARERARTTMTTVAAVTESAKMAAIFQVISKHAPFVFNALLRNRKSALNG